MNVIYVSRVKLNPYVRLLANAMERVATRVDSVVSDEISPNWLWRQRDEVDVLHFHWAELLYSSATWRGMWLRWLRLISTVLLAKLIGVRVAYTVHNLSQHEGDHALLNKWTNSLMFRASDVIHVHDESVRRAVADRFDRTEGVAVIPHGSYLSYPNSCTREEARQQLDIPDSAFVYLFLGLVRPYKGVEELVRAFSALPDEDAMLVVAGSVHTPEYAQRIDEIAARDERIRLDLEFVPEEELQFYMNAADICPLPYRHVTTSGAALLAFSFAKPIIAPALGAFPELLDAPRGLVYDPSRDSALLEAMVKARQIDLEPMGRAAFELASSLDWIGIAQQHLAAYDAV